MKKNDFLKIIEVNGENLSIYDINRLEVNGIAKVSHLPFSIKILVENLLRKLDGFVVKEDDLKAIANWQKKYTRPVEIPHHPARVLMQDFTGVPAVVDLAAMRDAMAAMGGDPEMINPLVPVDLVVDHSVQVDRYGAPDALEYNVQREYERNGERYELLKWAQKSFAGLKVVPPRSGICHQVNLEHLGQTIITQEIDGQLVAFPDSLVGTDSHTTMINGIGVMGWGVGGIEAEAVMLGQPYYMAIPEVVGVRLVGQLNPGVTATDLVLRITELLRAQKVVEKFVEFFGPGMTRLSVTDRATIANMSPEYGATMGFFPVDGKTVDYLQMTGRKKRAAIVDACCRVLGLLYDGDSHPEYSEVVELDLATVGPAISGPARPQDRIPLQQVKETFAKIIGCEYEAVNDPIETSRFFNESGCRSRRVKKCVPVNQRTFQLEQDGEVKEVGDGSIVIAAITSCTNTSNPSVLLGAGLVAKKAVEKEVTVPGHVKTSLAPGSKVVTRYLNDAGLTPYLERLGFHTAAFGCTTCIGNSGPLDPAIEQLIREHDLNVAAVLSGNRNFEARIHQLIKSNFLASPMLVVAFALAGRIDIDLATEPLGFTPDGEPVYLLDLWPENEDINDLVQKHVKESFFKEEYGRIFEGDQFWQDLQVTESTTFAWNPDSTYIKRPPYFDGFTRESAPVADIDNAKVLLLLGDTVTTDHISPAGAIALDYPAGKHLLEKGVARVDFNSYGSRRGNHEVMMRGTFGNIRIKNLLVAPKEGSFTLKFPEKEDAFIFDAAMAYAKAKTPLLVLGGKEYGTGSSRDWAAKGTRLLGVRAVITRSFERIHRSNLVGMGVLPLVFKEGEDAATLGLDGSETFTIKGLADMGPGSVLTVTATHPGGKTTGFEVVSRLDTEVEVAYFQNGGILPYVMRRMLE